MRCVRSAGELGRGCLAALRTMSPMTRSGICAFSHVLVKKSLLLRLAIPREFAATFLQQNKCSKSKNPLSKQKNRKSCEYFLKYLKY